MAYREIISKAVISKGKKGFKEEGRVKADNSPSTILGCWVINHKFNGVKQNEKINISGSYDINIWYSYDNDTKTDVVKETHTYNEIVKMHDVLDDYDNVSIVLRSLTDPKCVKVEINDNTINYQVDLELGIELVGDVKIKVPIDETIDEYREIVEETSTDKEIDNEVNPNYLEKE